MGRVKNLDEIKTMIRERAGKRNTFRHAKREDVESVLANLTSKDPELWAKEWSRIAKPYEEAGVKREQAGKFQEAREAYVQAYAYYATGRYPTPHTPESWHAIERASKCTRRPANTSSRRWSGSIFLSEIRKFRSTCACRVTGKNMRS